MTTGQQLATHLHHRHKSLTSECVKKVSRRYCYNMHRSTIVVSHQHLPSSDWWQITKILQASLNICRRCQDHRNVTTIPDGVDYCQTKNNLQRGLSFPLTCLCWLDY